MLGSDSRSLFSLAAAWLLSCAALAPGPAPTAAVPRQVATAEAAADARFSLSSGSKRILSSLAAELRVDAYVPEGVTEVEAYVADLTRLLREYERQGAGKLRVRIIVPKTAEERAEAQSRGVNEQPFGSDEGSARYTPGFLGLAFRYKHEQGVIPALAYPDATGLEFWISNKIRELRDRAEGIRRRVGVISGKGELKLSDAYLAPQHAGGKSPSLSSIFEQAFPFYHFEEVALARGAAEIDDRLDGIIVTQPRDDYEPAELKRIDDFLLRGGKALVVYASAVNVQPGDASMQATLSTKGLVPLLDGYGIHINRDAVLDHGAAFGADLLRPDTVKPVRHRGILRVVDDRGIAGSQRLDGGFAGFFKLHELMFPFASSLELRREQQPADVTLRVVARTSPEATSEVSDIIDLQLREQWPHTPPSRQLALAAYAQGALKSAFGSNRAPRPSRVLVVSSSLFLANPFAYAARVGGTSAEPDAALAQLGQTYTKHLTATILSFKNTLDWMTGDDELVSLSSRLLAPRSKALP